MSSGSTWLLSTCARRAPRSNVIADLLVHAEPGENYESLDEAGKGELLQRLLVEPAKAEMPSRRLSNDDRDVLDTVSNIRKAAEEFSEER